MAGTKHRVDRHRSFHREHLLYLLYEIERVAEKAAPELSSDDAANVVARLVVVLSKVMPASGEGTTTDVLKRLRDPN